MTYLETDYTQLKNFVELPKSSLKWQDGEPYIVHLQKVHRAVKVEINGQVFYEVKKYHSKWLIRIA